MEGTAGAEVVLIEFVGDAKSSVAASQETVAGLDEVTAAADRAGAATAAAGKEAAASGKKSAAAASESAAAAKASSGNISKSFAASGATMTKVGKGMTKWVSLPLVGIGVAATKMSLDYSKAMLLIETHTDTSRKTVEQYRKSVLAMSASGKFTQGPKEMAEALYHIASDGYKGAKALDVLRNSAHLATLGQSNLAETTYALVSAQKTGIRGTESLHNTIGELNGIVGAGDMKMQDLVGAMSTGILPAAKSAGLSLKDVGAALDVLTQRGVPAQQGAYRLAMTFQMMIPHTEKALGAFHEIGLSQDSLTNKLHGPHGLLDALELLQEHLAGMSKPKQQVAIEEMFGGGRTSRGLLTLIQNLDGLKESYGSINHLAGETNKNLATALKSPANVWAKQWAQLQAALVEVGNELVPVVIPALKEVAHDITGLLADFSALPGPVKSFGIEAGVAAIALGPMVRLVGGLSSGLGAVIKLGGKAATSLGLVTTAAEASGGAGAAAGATGATTAGAAAGAAEGVAGGDAAASGLASAGAAAAATQPEILAAAAATVALSAGLIELYKHSKTFREEVGGLGQAVSHAASEIKATVAPLIASFQHLGHAFSNVPIVKQLEEIHGPLGSVTHLFHTVFVEGIRAAFKEAGHIISGLGKIFAASTQVISGLVNTLSDLLEGKFGKAWHDVEGVFRSGLKIVGGAIEAGAAPLKTSIEATGKVMSAAFGGIWSDIEGTFKGGINDVIGLINDLIKAINVIPGIPNIGEVGSVGSTNGTVPKGVPKHQKVGTTHRARGGAILEGAPSGDSVPAVLERGEYVLNRKAVAKVGKGQLDRINFQHAPRFAFGGPIGEAIGSAGSAIGHAASSLGGKALGTLTGALDSLPTPHLPKWISGLGGYLVNGVKSYITSGFKDKKFGTQTTGGGTFSGPTPPGVGSWGGFPVDNWIIPELNYARAHGWSGDITSGYRTPAHSAELGYPGDEHTKTSYPGGAVDFGGMQDPAGAANRAAFMAATAGYKGPKLRLPIGFHDDGHTSGTGHARGGLIGKLKRFAKGGFAGSGYTVKGAPASAQQMHTAMEIMEAADTTGAPHLARVAAAMAATQESDMGAATSNTFELTSAFNGVTPSSGTLKQAIEWFTKGYYDGPKLGPGGGIAKSHKSNDPGLIAQEVEGSAYPTLYEQWKSEGQKWTDGWSGKLSGAASKATKAIKKQITGHYMKDKVGVVAHGKKPDEFTGELVKAKFKVLTGKLSLGSLPTTLPAARKELRERQRQLPEYKAAMRQVKDAETKRAINANVKILEDRISALNKLIGRLLAAKRRETKIKKIEGRGTFPAIEAQLAQVERNYAATNEEASQISSLEPEEPPNFKGNFGPTIAAYVEGQEGPAWSRVLGTEATWRDTLLKGEATAASRLGSLEGQLDHIEGLKKSKKTLAAYKKEKFKIPALKQAITAVQGAYNPKTKLGTFEEQLEGVQGPSGSRDLLASLPTEPVPGTFGGAIWDTQMAIRELGIKIREALAPKEGEAGETNDALLEAKLAMAENINRERALKEVQYGPLAAFLKAAPPYIGAFKDGGNIPGPPSAAYTATVHGGETIVPYGGGSTAGPLDLHLHGDIASLLEVAAPGLAKEIDRRMGEKYRHIRFGPTGRKR